MPIAGTIKLKAGQFLQLGEDPPGVRLELFDGEVAASPSPTPEHSSVDRRLSRLLGNHVDRQNLGEIFGDVDPTARTIEAFRLVGGRYTLAASAKGDETLCAPPFADLVIPLGELWRPRPAR